MTDTTTALYEKAKTYCVDSGHSWGRDAHIEYASGEAENLGWAEADVATFDLATLAAQRTHEVRLNLEETSDDVPDSEWPLLTVTYTGGYQYGHRLSDSEIPLLYHRVMTAALMWLSGEYSATEVMDAVPPLEVNDAYGSEQQELESRLNRVG